MNFKGIKAPFELVAFRKMNKKQAKQYFEWFVDTIDERLSILQEYIINTGGDFVLDKTPESLISLWEWFIDKIEMVQKSEEEINEELKVTPERLRYHILEDTTKISENTMLILYNISAYFGEVMINKYPQLYWGYLTTPKKLDGVNAPRLVGFNHDMTVYIQGRVEVLMYKTIENNDKMYLYNHYLKCLKYFE